MKSTKWLLLPLLFMVPVEGFAAEELSDNQLAVVAKVPRGGDFLGFGFDSLWMVTRSDQLARVSAADNSVVDIELEGTIGKYRGIATGEGAIWIPDVGAGKVYKVDPAKNRVTNTFQASMSESEGSIGVGEGAVWITTADDNKTLARYSAVTGAREATIALPGPGIGVVVDFGSVWVTGYQTGELYRINPETNTVVMTTKLHEGPRFVASGQGAVWVLNQSDGTVQRVDGSTGEVRATIETGLSAGSGGDIICGGGYVWVSLPGVPVAQIDPKTNTLVRAFRGWDMGDAIRYGAGSLWISGPMIYRIAPPQ